MIGHGLVKIFLSHDMLKDGCSFAKLIFILDKGKFNRITFSTEAINMLSPSLIGVDFSL